MMRVEVDKIEKGRRSSIYFRPDRVQFREVF